MKTSKFRVRHHYWTWGVIAIAALALIVLGTYNQPYYPATWLDEGFTLQGAMNLVRYGQYAMRSSEGLRIFDQPLIANGPGVVVPISLAFALFGISLNTARTVMAGYFVVTTLLYFSTVRRLFETRVALISTIILLALPDEGFLLYGRHTLGMIPALCYFLIGYGLWLTAIEHQSMRHAIGAGLLFGLTIVTKSQYLLLIPAIAVVVAIDRWRYKSIDLRQIGAVLAGMAVCLIAWYGVQLAVLGWDQFAHNLAAVSSSSRITVAAFRLQRLPNSVWYLIHSGFVPLILPGILYAVWLAWQDRTEARRWLLPIALIGVWLAWYAVASVGWPRYAFDPYALGILFAGKLIMDARHTARPIETSGRHRRFLRLSASGLIVIIGLSVTVSGLQQVVRIRSGADSSAEQFAAYLMTHVDSQTVIESWEWELDVLVDRNYHHPTNNWVDLYTAVTQFHDPVKETYNPSSFHPGYLILGPFARKTGIYTDYLAQGCCQPVITIGQYQLLAVNATVSQSNAASHR